MRKKVIILGSTGSIGLQAIDILSNYTNDFEIVALSTNTKTDLLLKQISMIRPKAVAVSDKNYASKIKASINKPVLFYDNIETMVIETEADIVLNAIVGFAGLLPTLAALNSSKDVALANKESLVAAGEIVMETARKTGRRILPVDSEHSAILQCIPDNKGFTELRKVCLTASGGPFRKVDRELLATVSVEDALNHPHWNMGRKITIDSATLMNKGLEVIEAKWLFNLKPHQIKVVVHPQSIVHSFVEFHDGSILAQLGKTDMRLPILYALTYPKRFETQLQPPDLIQLGMLTFEEPDYAKFPSLTLAFEAIRVGGTMPTVLNAANEIAVTRFLNREIPFVKIPDLVETAMSKHINIVSPNIQDIMEADLFARKILEY